jgi:DnaJ-class molecular chaperone
MIQEAYLVLSDPKSRLKYDMYLNNLNNTVTATQSQAPRYSSSNMSEAEKKSYAEKQASIERMVKNLEKAQKKRRAEEEIKKEIEQQRVREETRK